MEPRAGICVKIVRGAVRSIGGAEGRVMYLQDPTDGTECRQKTVYQAVVCAYPTARLGIGIPSFRQMLVTLFVVSINDARAECREDT